VNNLLQISEHIYKSVYGYFILRNNKWMFTPLEKEFDTDDLMNISDILRNLNENELRTIC